MMIMIIQLIMMTIMIKIQQQQNNTKIIKFSRTFRNSQRIQDIWELSDLSKAYVKSSNKRPLSFKCFSPINVPPKIRKSLWTPPSFKLPLLIKALYPQRRVFIRKIVTYLFKPILSVGSRNHIDIIIYISNCCYFLWKSTTSGEIQGML